MLYYLTIMQPKKFYTIPEAAKKIGLSRSQVFRKVQAGQIPAQRFGKNYLIDSRALNFLTGEIDSHDIRSIEKAVRKTLKDYGEVIRDLGDQ